VQAVGGEGSTCPTPENHDSMAHASDRAKRRGGAYPAKAAAGAGRTT
jgi:hypothetical protein